MNYCDDFYGTDENGEKIYSLKIKNTKGNYTYAELFEKNNL